MADRFSNKAGIKIVERVIATLQENREYLSEIDGAIGDGDHGVNMGKGATIAGQKLADGDFDLAGGLKVLGDVLLMEIGGAMGPLYGTFFKEMYKTSVGREWVDLAIYGAMLQEGLAGVKRLGKAEVGDKTMVDTLEPAVRAYQAAMGRGDTFIDALAELDGAAAEGMESTKALVARVGRASRLGERSRGVLDAGATSAWLVLKAMSDAARSILQAS